MRATWPGLGGVGGAYLEGLRGQVGGQLSQAATGDRRRVAEVHKEHLRADPHGPPSASYTTLDPRCSTEAQ